MQRNRVLSGGVVFLFVIVLLCSANVQQVAAFQDEMIGAADNPGQSIFKPPADPFEMEGWCEWTCSDGDGGAGPAGSLEDCLAICEISCGEPCEEAD